MARLIVIDGPDAGHEYELDSPADPRTVHAIVGRDPRVAIPIHDSAVSREHCRIEISAAGCRLIDLGSRNRTYLNGDPVEKSWLRDGDVLLVGDTELRFEDDSPPVETASVASTIIKEIDSIAGMDPEPDPGTSIQTAPGGNGAMFQQVLRLAACVAGAASLRELFDAFFAEIVPAAGADHGAFLVREGGHWTAKAQFGGNGPPEPRFLASLAVIERAARERKALLAAAPSAGGPDAAGPGAGGAVAAPVISRGEVAGVVYLDRRSGGPPFPEWTLDLVRAAVEPVSAALERVEAQGRLVDENRNLMRSLAADRRIIGSSEAIAQVLEFIRRAAPAPMTVLIQGETGTGKELVASAIHYASSRRGRPFVALNCAALPENLAESELFGHERGAFTGAVSRKKGRFELASGGTVFLDEVGELTLACQAKLLRLLEERHCERVGGTEPVEVDVRILAATNKDILEAVVRKEFREDLYYRLSVLNVKLPPLRERPEDIPLLVEHFLSFHARGGQPKKLAKSAEKKLLRYSWPGNVRQLRNVIESALVLGEDREIRAEDIYLPEKAAGAAADGWQPVALAELERRHVLKVLEHTNGNKKRAAEILGIERCTLYSKLKNYAD